MTEREERSSIETRVRELDPAILTSVVRRMLSSETAEIVDWHPQYLAAGSTRGSVFRLKGTGREPPRTVPWSIILKFVPSPWSSATKYADARDDPAHYDYWRRELLVYESGLFSDLPDGLAAPKCFHVQEETDGYWLWLEDIQDLYDQTWPLSHYGIAARHLGRFNGQYLTGKEMPPFPWLVPHQQRTRETEKRKRETKIWAKLAHLKEDHAIIRRAWPDHLLEDYHRLWVQPDWLYQALEALPKVLKHGDAGHRNLLARQRGDGTTETVAIDWAFLGIASVGEELVSLVGSTVVWFGVPSTQLSELDQVAFEGYLQGLRDVGWRGSRKLVRLGYTAYMAAHWTLILSGMPEILAVDEEGTRQCEALMGAPIEEIADNSAAVRRFVLACANEARELKDST